jgi:hypothetical protein
MFEALGSIHKSTHGSTPNRNAEKQMAGAVAMHMMDIDEKSIWASFWH